MKVSPYKRPPYVDTRRERSRFLLVGKKGLHFNYRDLEYLAIEGEFVVLTEYGYSDIAGCVWMPMSMREATHAEVEAWRNRPRWWRFWRRHTIPVARVVSP